MKSRLRRILSILCVLALLAGCASFAAFAEEDTVIRVIIAQWNDEDNYEGLRKSSLTMSIGGKDYILNDANNWTAEATAAADAAWTFETVEGYTVSSRGTDVTTVTYTHTPSRTFLDAQVVWNDGNNASGLRPDAVSVALLADGVPFRSAAAANGKNEWKVSWTDLPVYRKGSATEKIVYSVSQLTTPEYYATAVSGATVTNTLQTGTLNLKTSVTGYPEGADVSGLKLTVDGPDPKMPVNITYGDVTGGTYSLGEVVPGAYLVRENNADSLVEGYAMDSAKSQVADAVTVKAGEASTLNFSYAYKEAAEADEEELKKADLGALTIEILGPDERMPMTVTYAQFKDGRFELDNLKAGEYVVVERNAAGLIKTYNLASSSVTGLTVVLGKDGATATLYNRYVPAPTPKPDDEEIDIPVVKIWNDDNNKDGNRPASVTVHLYANAVLNETVELTEAQAWTYIFTGKPRYDETGKEIEYTVNEDPVEWYTASINGIYITNTYNPEVTSASFRKAWDDNGDEQERRPKSIAVTLLPVGEVYVLNEENGWTVTLNNLPTRINGEDVTYTWKEQETAGYVLAGAVTDGTATTFTNKIAKLPDIPKDQAQPKLPQGRWAVFEEYDTALGIPILINHVGDCFD